MSTAPVHLHVMINPSAAPVQLHVLINPSTAPGQLHVMINPSTAPMHLHVRSEHSSTVLTDVFMKKEKIKEEEPGDSKTFIQKRPFSGSIMPAKKRKTAKDVEENPNNKSDARAGGEKRTQMSKSEKAPYQARADKRIIDCEKGLKASNKRLADGSRKSRSELETATDSETDSESGSETETETETDSESGSEAEAQAQAQTDSSSDSGSGSSSSSDSDSD